MLRRIANLTGVEPNVILQVRARFVTTWPTSVPLRSQSMVASAATRRCDTRLDQHSHSCTCSCGSTTPHSQPRPQTPQSIHTPHLLPLEETAPPPQSIHPCTFSHERILCFHLKPSNAAVPSLAREFITSSAFFAVVSVDSNIINHHHQPPVLVLTFPS